MVAKSVDSDCYFRFYLTSMRLMGKIWSWHISATVPVHLCTKIMKASEFN